MSEPSPAFYEDRFPRFRRFRRVRRARVLNRGVLAGFLEETPSGYRFTYAPEYLADPSAPAVSLTLPRQAAPHESRHLFAFFHGLLAEGRLKRLQCRTLKIDEDDHFGRLVATAGGDVIGSVTVEPDA
ncbi:MAG: HipA N-terminal domain-containing protein [Planctomycetes bacterium]|nr:HipA N-terminal domain-containing protein [Planctomycetota bacterium]